MDDETLLQELDRRCPSTRDHAAWKELAPLLDGLEKIGRSGSHALVKVDGDRTDAGVYTVAVSGGRLGETFFRKDGTHLPLLLREAIAFYVTHAN